MKRITILLGAGILFLCSMVYAAVPQLINFQGILRDGSGNLVANGSYFATFRIYGVPSGGTALWVDTQTVATNVGLFNAILGKGAPVPDSVFIDSVRYLGITVFPDGEMSPRQRLSSIGYAFQAGWNTSGNDIYRPSGNVGIGTANPGDKLEVALGSGSVSGVIKVTKAVGTVAEIGSGGTSADEYGYIGLYHQSQVTPKVQIYAAGDSWFTGGNVGIGTTTPTAKLNVETSAGIGVYGYSALGYGVYGSGSSTTVGVYGTSTSGNGVVGSSTSGHGVFGQSFSGFAGYFSGNAHVAGTLTKTAGSFKIDHPTDPANKYLYHSFVESPDMMNIYNGNVTLDSKGEAVIVLPDWFGALNKDFRYQLTCIGGFAQVYVAEKVKDNRFKIAGGTAGLEVSWQVTGIRQDAYANAHRIPVEEIKVEKERGYYLHPDLFGQPEEKSIEWARHPEMMKEMKERRMEAEKEKK